MIESRRFTKYFTVYLLVYIICTNSFANSQDEEAEEEETTTTEVPPEAPEPGWLIITVYCLLTV